MRRDIDSARRGTPRPRAAARTDPAGERLAARADSEPLPLQDLEQLDAVRWVDSERSGSRDSEAHALCSTPSATGELDGRTGAATDPPSGSRPAGDRDSRRLPAAPLSRSGTFSGARHGWASLTVRAGAPAGREPTGWSAAGFAAGLPRHGRSRPTTPRTASRRPLPGGRRRAGRPAKLDAPSDLAGLVRRELAWPRLPAPPRAERADSCRSAAARGSRARTTRLSRRARPVHRRHRRPARPGRARRSDARASSSVTRPTW